MSDSASFHVGQSDSSLKLPEVKLGRVASSSTPALSRMRQDDLSQFKASLDYIVPSQPGLWGDPVSKTQTKDP